MDDTPIGVVSLTLVGYAYPWDHGDRLARVVDDLQPDRVAVAGLYHSVRAIDRTLPGHHVVDAWHSARYLPGRAWDGLAIQPPPGRWSTPDDFIALRDQLQAAGVAVDAWLVLNHLEGIPGVSEWNVVTALGRELPYTQCPSHPQVRAHMRAAVTAALVDGAADGLVLEAITALGAVHPVAHDKSRGVFAPLRSLASWCFCVPCQQRRSASGPPAHAAVRAALRGDLPVDAAPVMAAQEQLAADRIALARDVLAELTAAARGMGCERIAVFAAASPYGFAPGVPIAAIPGEVDVVIGSAWGGPEQTDTEFTALAGRRRGLYVNVAPSPPGALDPEPFAARWPADEIHLYHLGLADDTELRPWARRKD